MSGKSLLYSLRERKVFRSAGYYVLGAWLVLQVGDVVVEPAGLPVWTMTAVLYLLAFGFPVAIFLGWRYDITEHGIVRTGGGSDYDPQLMRLKTGDYLLIALLLAILGFAVYRMVPAARESAEIAQRERTVAPVTTASSAGSIAVLPFADLGEDGEGQFLGDGISDTVMHVLAQIKDLDVTARTSSFVFKDSGLGIREIAAALGVANVLEGSVQQAGNKVRIIARLVSAASGIEVWSGYYDRTLDSIFAIQDEIAQEVATALMVNVLGTGDVRVGQGYEPDLAAYEQLILGRAAGETGTVDGFKEAYERFQRAVDIDPNYALAHVMLADSLPSNGRRLGLERSEVTRRSQELIDKALDLNPLLPEAYAAQADLHHVNKKFDEAMKATDRALELRPSFARAYAVKTAIYYSQSRFEDALPTARRAIELDPEDNGHMVQLARVRWSLGRSEAAIGTMRDAIARDPEMPGNYLILARYLRQTGHTGEAQYWTNRALALDPEAPYLKNAYCMGMLQLWAMDEAQACLKELLRENPGDPDITNWYAMLSDDIELGLENTRQQVAANPSFWYRKMQLSDWLLRTGAHEEMLDLFRGAFPGLFANPPEVNDMTVWAARNMVRALQGLGRDEEAGQLIDAALDHLERQRKLQGTQFATGTDDVFLLAMDGRHDEAAARLRKAIVMDWQYYSFGLNQPVWFPDGLAENVRFQEQVDELAAIMAEERAWYEANKDREPEERDPLPIR